MIFQGARAHARVGQFCPARVHLKALFKLFNILVARGVRLAPLSPPGCVRGGPLLTRHPILHTPQAARATQARLGPSLHRFFAFWPCRPAKRSTSEGARGVAMAGGVTVAWALGDREPSGVGGTSFGDSSPSHFCCSRSTAGCQTPPVRCDVRVASSFSASSSCRNTGNESQVS